MISRHERVEGALLGLLVGDALGVPYEFHDAQQIPPSAQVEFDPPPGFGRSHASVPPGTWSDDGAQALCLLASLLDQGSFEITDFAERLVNWYRHGYLAVDAEVFDIGIQTSVAIRKLAKGADPQRSGPAGERDNGNGSLMRVLPLALWHQGEDEALMRDAMRSSLPTHGHLRSQLCCALYCLWARRMLEGEAQQDQAWKAAKAGLERFAAAIPGAAAELAVIDLGREAGGSGSGYVVDCLHSARLALEQPSYEGVVKAAIALGDDTDTTAAVAGGLAGLREGSAAIPPRWRQALRGAELLDPLLALLLKR